MRGCLRNFSYKLNKIRVKLALFGVFCCVLARKIALNGS